MAEDKIRLTGASVEAFLRNVADERRRQECYGLVGLMQNLVGEPARMWGESTVGFGSRRVEGAGATFRLGFSPRKSEMCIHLGCRFEGFEPTLARLGKHRLGRDCVYLKSFDDINLGVLRQLLLDANIRLKAG